MGRRTEQMLIELIKTLPSKNTKGEDLAYTIGYLIGVISRLSDQDSLVGASIAHELKQRKNKELL